MHPYHPLRLAREAVITDTETPYDTEADLTDADGGFSSIISIVEAEEEERNSQAEQKDRLKRLSSARSRTDLDVRGKGVRESKQASKRKMFQQRHFD